MRDILKSIKTMSLWKKITHRSKPQMNANDVLSFGKRRRPLGLRNLLIILGVSLGILAAKIIYSLVAPHHEEQALTTAPITPSPPASAENKSPVATNDLIKEAQKLLSIDKAEASIPLYEKILAANKFDYVANNDIGLAYLKLGQFEQAEKYFQSALSINKKCYECLNNLGYLNTLMGKELEAENNFNQAVAINDKYPDPFFNLGVLYEKNGDLGNAAHAYRKFLEIADKNDAAFSLRVKTHLFSMLER